MDKNEALVLSKKYLKKLKKSDFNFAEAWLFGSYANGSQKEYSDIDLAIVFSDSKYKTFDNEVKLMNLRIGDETQIEPHAFTLEDFSSLSPLVNQIIKEGIRVEA